MSTNDGAAIVVFTLDRLLHQKDAARLPLIDSSKRFNEHFRATFTVYKTREHVYVSFWSEFVIHTLMFDIFLFGLLNNCLLWLAKAESTRSAFKQCWQMAGDFGCSGKAATGIALSTHAGLTLQSIQKRCYSKISVRVAKLARWQKKVEVKLEERLRRQLLHEWLM